MEFSDKDTPEKDMPKGRHTRTDPSELKEASNDETVIISPQPESQGTSETTVIPIMKTPSPQKQKKGLSGKKKALISVGIVIGVLAVAYIAFSVFFMFRFGFNTTISGMDCSFKSVSEVEQMLSDHADGYELELIERDGGSETISGEDISFSYDPQAGQVQAILDSQNGFLFFMRIFDSSSIEPIYIEYDYDESALDEQISALDCVNDTEVIQPENAYPEFNGTEYVVHEEVLGTVIDTEALTLKANETVLHGLDSLDLDEGECYVSPEVTSDSAELQERIALLNTYTPFALTYTFSDGSTEILDGETIFDWLTINEDDSYTVSEGSVESWVSDFASRHDTVGQTRTFTSVDGNTYTVSGGTYGWSIDQDAEIESIYNMIETKQSETRDPYWATTAESNATDGSADWGNTYVELNLTSQHVYFVQDGVAIFEADVVTGLPNGSYDTPQGVYYILEKMLDKTLRGEIQSNGLPEYETPVDYWMRITWTGIGFHDATWQSAFGGTRYLTYGSHGCINMSLSDAATLYDLVWIGLPVVSHY